VRTESESPIARFEPLRPASRKRLIVGIVIGPVLWVIALSTVAWVLHVSFAIELGLLLAAICGVVSAIVLVLVRHARIRQEDRYAARG
jgi:hypothetical protein